MSDLQRINSLRTELHKHNYLYHTLGRPLITDAEYDALYQELLRLEARHPEAADPNSPTQRVGAPVDGFAKVTHARRMLSLDNAFTADDVLGRLDRVHAVLEPKVDGLSLKLVYRNGRLDRAVTRGDGMQGDDVTTNARTIATVPLVLPHAVDLEVTGEVYMTYSRFNALNRELEKAGEELLANPRNAAAGTLKSKHPGDVAQRRLHFVAHGCVTELPGVTTHLELMAYLERMQFQSTRLLPQTKGHAPVTTDLVLEDAGALSTAISDAQLRLRYLDLPTDGLVFKVNSLALQRELGEGTKSPRWAVAYKFPPERKATRLTAVTLQVGRTGRITPVAEVEPVQLSGTTVRRASLFNFDEIRRLGVDIGKTVVIEKSAEIIPRIVAVNDRTYLDPKTGRRGTLKALLEAQSKRIEPPEEHL